MANGFQGTILQSPFFVNAVLPFLLVFVLIFAVLQKSQVLGKGKRQIDALVALVVGLTVIAFGYPTGIIVSLIPFLAVFAVVILVFMLLYSMFFQGTDFQLGKGMRITGGIVVLIAVVVAVLFVTGAWDTVLGYFYGSSSGNALFINGIFIAIIVGAVLLVLFGGKEGKD